MQTILGSNGVIAREMLPHLGKYTNKIRLVSRNPKKILGSEELMALDLTDPANIEMAVKGSEVVYITIGFPYTLKDWQVHWPSFMANTIKFCKKHKSKLVFFDNVYMYGKESIPSMTEDSPHNPPSKKGVVRTEVANMLIKEMKGNELDVIIARSADFYGPGIESNSMFTEIVLKNLSAGKAAFWLVSLDKPHSLTYTPDAGKATAILGNTEVAYNQVWHLPTAPNPLTGRELIELAARQLNAKPKIMVLKPWFIGLLGLFQPVMKEIKEMLYQYDRDYVFRSDKFNDQFQFTPTSYQDGVKECIEADFDKT